MENTAYEKLYDYQKTGVNWLTDNKSVMPYHSLLGDDMGLGKTAQLIVAAEKVNAAKILVICPNTTKINWMREFMKWSAYTDIFIIKTGKDKIPADASVYIINYDLVNKPAIKKQLLAMRFDCGLVDEAHYLQSAKAQRTKAVLGKTGVLHTCKYKWLATGTFMPNRPKNMFAILKTLAPYVIDPYLTYDMFAIRYCGAFMGAFGLDDTGCSNAEELGDRLKPFMLRRLKEDVLDQLPEKTVQYIYLEHTEAIKKALDLERQLSEEEVDAICEFRDLGNSARIRHELALAKIDQCVMHIRDQMLTLNKLVVFAHHKKAIDFLVQELDTKYGVCLVTGGMSGAKKQQQVDDFVNNPDKKIFIGQLQAAGVGIDGLQLVASNIIFIETSWTPGEIDQAIDRCVRIGQKHNVHVQFLVVPDSLEEKIISSEMTKRKNINKIISRVETRQLPTQIAKGKEKIMTLEKNIERIAKATEKILAIMEDRKHQDNDVIPVSAGETTLALSQPPPVSSTQSTPEPKETLDPDVQIQRRVQELAKKTNASNAVKCTQETIYQIGGDIDDGTGGFRPAKLTDLTYDAKLAVVDVLDAKISEV